MRAISTPLPMSAEAPIPLPGPAMPHGLARQWAKTALRYAEPSMALSLWQVLSTALPLAGLWMAMMLTVENAYWATLLLAIPAAGLTVRLFIIQHDCGHRSFFRSRRLNDTLGALIGVITLTPHEYWRRAHNIHHATCGNLRQRGIGDVTVLTVAEYTALPRWKRLAYRIYRHPAVLLGIGPLYLFGVKYRLPLDLLSRHPKLLISVMGTNLAIAAIVAGLGLSFGFVELLMVQGPIMALSSTAGVWLFYVQHQFERTHWRDDGGWDFHDASVLASSYYVLPQPLRWLTCDIGIHHVHHLACRVPNYRLGACLNDIPALGAINRIGLRESLSCFRLAVWDEAAQRLVSFKALRSSPAAA